MHIPQDVVRSPLYVITAIFNPVRSKSRWALYRDFQRHIRESGAVLVTIEAAFGERTHALEQHAVPAALVHSGEPKSFGPAHVPPAASLPASRQGQDYLKLRVGQDSEIWLKENLLNLALRHLPPDWRYVAFVDADVQFTRPDWVSETLHALQHFDVVQMFSTAMDLSPTHEPLQAHQSFGFNHVHGASQPVAGDYYYGGGAVMKWHPGFAWAWRRSALNTTGALMDRAILGAADHHMAWSLVGQPQRSIHGGVSCGYRQMVMEWSARAADLKRNVGYIDGLLLHRWHGPKAQRYYKDRWQILIRNRFDPTADVTTDWQGVLKLRGNKPQLRDDIRSYLRSRNEDSIDVPDGDHRFVGPKPAAGWRAS